MSAPAVSTPRGPVTLAASVAALVLSFLVLSSGVATATTRSSSYGSTQALWIAGPVLPGTHCPVFPADNGWNTPIITLPIDPHSAAWLVVVDAED